MSKRKNHTDELFRSHLQNFEASPPAEAWQGIVSSLDSGRRRQRAVVFWRMAASVAVLVAIGTTLLLVRQDPEVSIAEREQAVETIEQRDLQETPPAMEEGVLAIEADTESGSQIETEAGIGTIATAQDSEPVLARLEREPSTRDDVYVEELPALANRLMLPS